MAQLDSMDRTYPGMDMGVHEDALTAMGRAVRRNDELKRELAVNGALKIFFCVSILVSLIIFIVAQSVEIYMVQKSISNTNTKILGVERSIESLNVELLKSKNLDETKKVVDNTEFKNKDMSKAIDVDLSKDNFPQVKIENDNKGGIKNFLSSLFR